MTFFCKNSIQKAKIREKEKETETYVNEKAKQYRPSQGKKNRLKFKSKFVLKNNRKYQQKKKLKTKRKHRKQKFSASNKCHKM